MKVVLLSILSVLVFASIASAQVGTAFTYQGRLMDGGTPATGSYDMEFRLFNDPSAGNQVSMTVSKSAVAVNSGVFTVSLDFGAAFSGSKRWLAISVKPSAGSDFTLLTPRQELTPTPNAIYADSANHAVIADTVNAAAPLKIGQDSATVCNTSQAGSLRWNTVTVNLELCDGTVWRSINAGYTVGGTVSGLLGTGLKLQNVGTNTLTVSGASFTFTNPLPSGAGYLITVSSQPVNPVQSCSVGAGTGTIAGANVTNVAVTCSAPSATSLSVSGLTSPRTAGLAGGIVVAAKDSGGNIVPGYVGTVHFTSTDSSATLPSDYTFTLADSGIRMFSVTLNTIGTRSITATDTATSSITGTQSGITVTQGSTTTALALSSGSNPAVSGMSLTFTATVTGGAPTGTVTFKDGGVSIGACAAQTLSSGAATCTLSTLFVASHSITAVYNGDASYSGSTSGTFSETVNKASTTVATASSTNPAVFGQAVILTATISVTVPGSGSPSGAITFKDGGVSIGTCTVQTVSASAATCSIASLSIGSHSITATYNGDASFNTSTSNTLSQVVNTASTTVATVSATNPSVFGQLVTFTGTITVSAPGSGTPTGTITFKDSSVSIGACTLQTVSANVATCSTASLFVGTHSITASYNGDASFNGSTSSALSQVVNQAATGVTVGSSTSSTSFGQSVTFTASISVSSPGSGTPTGSVAFKDSGAIIGTCSAQTVSSGTATCSTSSLQTGGHSITAVYNGDASFSGASSSAISQTVNKALTTTALVSSANPSLLSLTVTFTATISGGSGSPTGTVTFQDGVSNISGCTNQAVTSATATCSTSSLSFGTHSITAVYTGDSNFSSSTSNAISQSVTALRMN